MLTTKSGKVFRIFHSQDCCENVRIVGTEGNWKDLVGKVIRDFSHVTDPGGDPPPEYSESWTWTEFIFKVDDHTVISRWLGDSNGYYSEHVDFEKIKQ
jgi:hypothetical protein